MMTFFEVRDRLRNLTEFRDSYHEYLDFTNRPTNLPAQMVRDRMQPMVPMAVESLRRIGLGAMVTHDAPARGGRKVRINVIRAIFRDHVIRAFSLDEREPLWVLEKGILAYRRLLWVQRIQLFNPIFWLFHFGLFAARVPILIFRMTGYDTSHAETLTSVRLYLIVFQFVYFYLLAEWVGLIDWIWFDILGP